MGQLTTHVLDTASGKPAKALKIELWRIAQMPVLEKTTMTNADGRADGPVLSGAAFARGIFELRFFAGDYLRSEGHPLAEPAFLDVIPVRFGIADINAHYHVPLLLSPYGYSTYRGS
jgi:5-hydroxyisourate hydrolase